MLFKTTYSLVFIDLQLRKWVKGSNEMTHYIKIFEEEFAFRIWQALSTKNLFLILL